MSTVNNIQFRGYIFDLDGVLVDSYDAWFHLINEGLELFGRPPVTEPQFRETWGQGLEADQQMFFPEWTIGEIIDFYNRSFQKHARHVRSEPDGLQTLSNLKQLGKSLGVASNSPSEIIRILLGVAGLSKLIDATAGADEVAQSKPAPDLILRVLEKLSLPIETACYIGDSNFDAEAAEAAGIFFIGYKLPGKITIQNLHELIS